MRSDSIGLIPRLLAGRYDGLITTPAYFVTLRRIAGGADIRPLPIPEGEPFLAGIYLSRKTLSEGRCQQIRKALQAIHQDGTLLRILLRYSPGSDGTRAGGLQGRGALTNARPTASALARPATMPP
ncbi:hypothetical protein J7U46_21230 [Pelomonas sp. V22]|uniref:hypothetical protein n=1 Tax=Pelomonas sp. V22 TaxID=2822139 RepID=UPI0024A7F237|nr:hypothetical protein [Pelomonas sp. V22]MDI4635601.1 hypothetical protein [Pelomonas sp. V22]